MSKIKGMRIEIKFTIPDDSPKKALIGKKFKELMDALDDKRGEKVMEAK